MTDWIDFFVSAIDRIHEPLTVVLSASGCREGWLQGELFRAGQQHGLCVNEHCLGNRQTADVSCGDGPEMVAEIKIVGGDYFPKMQGFIESDVERLRAVQTSCTRRFMILIIPRSDSKTRLAEYLDTCCFSSTCVERQWPGFRLRLWEIESNASTAAATASPAN